MGAFTRVAVNMSLLPPLELPAAELVAPPFAVPAVELEPPPLPPAVLAAPLAAPLPTEPPLEPEQATSTSASSQKFVIPTLPSTISVRYRSQIVILTAKWAPCMASLVEYR